MKLMTLQNIDVVKTLKTGEIYYADYSKIRYSNYKKQWKELSKYCGFSHCPIFCSLDGDILPIESSGLSESDNDVVLHLDVPDRYCRIMDYYQFSDYLYYSSGMEYDDIYNYEGEEALKNIDKYVKLYRPSEINQVDNPQICIDKIKPEWVIQNNELDEKKNKIKIIPDVKTSMELLNKDLSNNLNGDGVMKNIENSYNLNEEVYLVENTIKADDEAPFYENDISIKEVSPEEVDKIIETREPRGLFLTKEDDYWVAVDNLTGDAWTEAFRTKDLATKYLQDRDFEYDLEDDCIPFECNENNNKKEKLADNNLNESTSDEYVYSVGINLNPDDLDILKQDIDALSKYKLNLVGVTDNGDYTGDLFFEGKLRYIEAYLDQYVGGIQVNYDYLVPKKDFESTISSEYLLTQPFDLNKINLDESKMLKEELIEYNHGLGFSFPDVSDTLLVFCQWEGLLGYESELIDFDLKTELKDYLEYEGIYGYTDLIWNILEKNRAYCSDMDINDFENVCADLFIDPNEAKTFENNEESEINKSMNEDFTISYNFDEDTYSYEPDLKEIVSAIKEMYPLEELINQLSIKEDEDIDDAILSSLDFYESELYDYFYDQAKKEYEDDLLDIKDKKSWISESTINDRNRSKTLKPSEYLKRDAEKYKENPLNASKEKWSDDYTKEVQDYIKSESKLNKDIKDAEEFLKKNPEDVAEYRNLRNRIDDIKNNKPSGDFLTSEERFYAARGQATSYAEKQNKLDISESGKAVYKCDNCSYEIKLDNKEYTGKCPNCGEHHGFYELDEKLNKSKGLSIRVLKAYLDDLKDVASRSSTQPVYFINTEVLDILQEIKAYDEVIAGSLSLIYANEDERNRITKLYKVINQLENYIEWRKRVPYGPYASEVVMNDSLDETYDSLIGKPVYMLDLVESINEEASDINKKKEALADYFNLQPNQVSEEDGLFKVNNEVYFVGDYKESFQAAVDEIKMIYDDLGLDSFTQRFKEEVVTKYLDKDEVEKFINSELEYFTEQEPDADIEEHIRNLETFGDKVNYIRDLLGDEEFFKWAKDKVDLDGICHQAISEDGIAHFVSHYDGDEIELDGNLYAYRVE